MKQLFNAYVDRSLAYDYPCAIGLVCFGSEVTERCKLTAAYESFRESVKDSVVELQLGVASFREVRCD